MTLSVTRARLRQALGPLGDAMNDGQIYVTLTRLEKAGLVASEQAAGLPDRPDRKMYALTPAGQQRVASWLAEVSWPRPDLAEFHLKLVAAAAAGLADPLAIVDAQRPARRVFRVGQSADRPDKRDDASHHGHAGRLGGRQHDLHHLGDGARRQTFIGAGARARRDPQQVSAGLSAAQVLPALAGAILGIPAGIYLYKVLRHGQLTVPPLWWLLAVLLGTLLVVAGLTAIPARIGARRPAAEILRSELA